MSVLIEYAPIVCYWCQKHKPLYNVIYDGEAEGTDMGLCKSCRDEHE